MYNQINNSINYIIHYPKFNRTFLGPDTFLRVDAKRL